MSTMQRPALRSLEGVAFPVSFSAGAETRAKSMVTRCERAHRYLKDVLGFDPTLRLLVLSPDDWADHTSIQPYGMPHFVGATTIVVGAETGGFFQSIILMLDETLTPAQRSEMEAVYGVADGQPDLSPFADLLVVHELGHLFHEQVPFDFSRLWLRELFVNLCLHAYVAEAEPERLPALTVFPRLMALLPIGRVRHRSLEDFERLYAGVGPENYGWYQCRLHVAAGSIYDEGGTGALRRLYYTFAGLEGDVTDGRVEALLEQEVSPAAARLMRTWPA